MTRPLSALGNILRLARGVSSVQAPVDREEGRLHDLARIRIFIARLADGGDPFRLLAGRMSLDALCFQTGRPLRVGQRLTIQMLLHEGHTIEVDAIVTALRGRQAEAAMEVLVRDRPQLAGWLRHNTRDAA